MLCLPCAQVRVNYEFSKWGYKSFEPTREERSCEMLLFALRRCMIRHTAGAVLQLPPRTDELVAGARSHLPHILIIHTLIYLSLCSLRCTVALSAGVRV